MCVKHFAKFQQDGTKDEEVTAILAILTLNRAEMTS